MTLTVAYLLAAQSLLFVGMDGSAWDEARFTAADDGVVTQQSSPPPRTDLTAEEAEDGDGGASAFCARESEVHLPARVALGAPPQEHRPSLDAVAAHDARGPPLA